MLFSSLVTDLSANSARVSACRPRKHTKAMVKKHKEGLGKLLHCAKRLGGGGSRRIFQNRVGNLLQLQQYSISIIFIYSCCILPFLPKEPKVTIIFIGDIQLHYAQSRTIKIYGPKINGLKLDAALCFLVHGAPKGHFLVRMEVSQQQSKALMPSTWARNKILHGVWPKSLKSCREKKRVGFCPKDTAAFLPLSVCQ